MGMKRVYKPGSPGAERAKRGLTLTAIKKQVAANRSERRKYREAGLLGVAPR